MTCHLKHRHIGDEMKNYSPAEWLGVSVEIEFWRSIFIWKGVNHVVIVAVLDYDFKFWAAEMVE